jgi:shikimate kinase
MKNIVLIGMPGSGKSSIGRKVADKFGMNFTDTDEMITFSEGKSINDIFFEKGENYFRDCECRAAMEAAEMSNTIIATGGGLVLRESNIRELKKNGIIVFINRSAENILKSSEMEGRPLLSGNRGKIYDLFASRIDLYKSFANIEIDNNEDIEDTVSRIILAFRGKPEK